MRDPQNEMELAQNANSSHFGTCERGVLLQTAGGRLHADKATDTSEVNRINRDVETESHISNGVGFVFAGMEPGGRRCSRQPGGVKAGRNGSHGRYVDFVFPPGYYTRCTFAMASSMAVDPMQFLFNPTHDFAACIGLRESA